MYAQLADPTCSTRKSARYAAVQPVGVAGIAERLLRRPTGACGPSRRVPLDQLRAAYHQARGPAGGDQSERQPSGCAGSSASTRLSGRRGLRGQHGPATPGFPFSAVVGMDELRRPGAQRRVPGIGGVLVPGEEGHREVMIMRALARSSRTWTSWSASGSRAAHGRPDCGWPASAFRPGGLRWVSPGARTQPGARLVELRGASGPAARRAGHQAGADRKSGVQAGCGRGAPPRAVRRPGQPAARPPESFLLRRRRAEHRYVGGTAWRSARGGSCWSAPDGGGPGCPRLLDRFGLTVEAAAPREGARAGGAAPAGPHDADEGSGRWQAGGRNRISAARRRAPGCAAGRRAAPGGIGVPRSGVDGCARRRRSPARDGRGVAEGWPAPGTSGRGRLRSPRRRSASRWRTTR
jgi:hypothetical protein